MVNLIEVLDKGYVSLVDWLGHDGRIVNTARISHMTDKSYSKEDDIKLIKWLIDKNHTSPLEQVEFQFIVKAPLFVVRQWMRHRTWSYNELSLRYASVDLDYYVPDEIRTESGMEMSEKEQRDIISEMISYSHEQDSRYRKFLEKDVSKELARIILPVNLYTTFYAKVDLHNLFHFLELRRSAHAQHEIRAYASAIEQLISPIVPLTYQFWKEKVEEKS